MTNTLKPSFYNFYFEIQGIYVVYNSLNSTIAELDKALFETLRSGNFHPENYSDEINSFLVSRGFCVSDSLDETSDYLEAFEKARDHDKLQIQLFLATSCNLKCSYCYLSTVVNKGKVIKRPQIDSLIKWISSELSTRKYSKLYLEFYGGEPLLAKESLRYFFREFNDISIVSNIDFDYGIVTNGTLLDEEIIKLLIEHSVFMQITLDGDEGTHNNRRMTRDGKGTYKTILENINKVLILGGNENLKVRMNVDNGNWNEIESVARQCHVMGVKNFEVGWVVFQSPVAPDYNLNIEEDYFETRMLELYKLLDPFGYAPSIDEFTNLTTCMLHRYNSYVINPDLDVFKCDEVVDLKEYKIGHISPSGKMILNEKELSKYLNRNPANFPECLKCMCLPVCGSGCAVKALRTNGDFHSSYCETNEKKLRTRVENYILADKYKNEKRQDL